MNRTRKIVEPAALRQPFLGTCIVAESRMHRSRGSWRHTGRKWRSQLPPCWGRFYSERSDTLYLNFQIIWFKSWADIGEDARAWVNPLADPAPMVSRNDNRVAFRSEAGDDAYVAAA